MNGKQLLAHRVSYEIHIGAVDGQWVLHKCDTPHCVNPEHLFLGTHADNVKDKVKKNRQIKGENHGMSILTNDKIYEIRASAESYNAIGRKFGISGVWAAKIKRGECWKHLEQST